jgi:hypothetical protein
MEEIVEKPDQEVIDVKKKTMKELLEEVRRRKSEVRNYGKSFPSRRARLRSLGMRIEDLYKAS